MGQVYEYVFDHAESAILGAMADHAKDDGSRCFPSVGLIAWKTNYSVRQVQRVMGRLETTGVILPIAYKSGGRGFATEYQIVLAAAERKPPYQHAGTHLDATLRVATIARFKETCQVCLLPGGHGKGPDQQPWHIDRIVPARQGGLFTVDNVTLSCGKCNREKGAILSPTEKGVSQEPVGDEIDEKGAIMSGDPPVMSPNGDTATAPQPSITFNKNENEPPVEPDARDDGTEPSWFLPMRDLQGFANRDNRKFIADITEICADPKVKATPALLVASFASYYRANRLERGWSDPVAALRKTLEREIAKVGRLSAAAKEELLREVRVDPAVGPQPGPVEPAPWSCGVCRDQGYYLVDCHPAWCDHSGTRKTRTGHMDELDLDEIWKEVLAVFEAQLPRPTFETWFKPTRFIGVDAGKALVLCPNKFAVEWMERRLYQAVDKVLNQTVGLGIKLETVMVWGADGASVE